MEIMNLYSQIKLAKPTVFVALFPSLPIAFEMCDSTTKINFIVNVVISSWQVSFKSFIL